ncbi:hypothetical protein Tco_0097456 [Tanacetum coccineum]
MGRDTIQLKDVVSTISQECLLEFSSEYFIPKNLHLELPGPGDHIVDFPEGKIGNNRFFWVDEKVFPTVVAWRTAATKDDKPKANTYSVVDVERLDTHQMDLFNLIKAPNPTKVKTGTRQRTAHEGADTGVYGPTAAGQEIPVTKDAGATEAAVEPDLEKEVISIGPTIRKRRRQRDASEEGSKAPAKQDVTQSSKEKGVTGNQDSERSTPSPVTGSPGSIYQPGWGVPNSYRLDTPEACQDVVDHIAPPGYFSELRHLPNDEFLKEILLEDAIAANKSRAEKKKKSRVVCRTHGVGSAQHAGLIGIPVSVTYRAHQLTNPASGCCYSDRRRGISTAS